MVLPFLALENGAAAVDDLVVRDMRELLDMLAREFRHGSDGKAERGDTLPTVDDKKLARSRIAELPPSTMMTEP